MRYPVKYANRHGLITGSTGGGKTYTLASMAEHFVSIGTSTLLIDAKGDLEGLAANPANNVRFWDCHGKRGAKFSLSLHDLGTELLTRALELTEAQSGALDVAFTLAEMNDSNIHTIADMRAALHASKNMGEEARLALGNVTGTSAATVARALLKLERAGGNVVFDGQRNDVAAFIHGGLNIMQAKELVQSPALYSAMVLHILSEFYNRLPECGDLAAPRLVIFIDEAHLLFTDAPQGLVRRIEQITRLIRSKGVGLYYVTQAPSDIPAGVLAQLANRVQHRMGGATLADKRAIRAAAETLPLPAGLNGETAIMGLGIGQALYSFVGDDGKPEQCRVAKMPAPSVPLGLFNDLRAYCLGDVEIVRKMAEMAPHGPALNHLLQSLVTAAGMVAGVAVVVLPIAGLIYWLI